MKCYVHEVPPKTLIYAGKNGVDNIDFNSGAWGFEL